MKKISQDMLNNIRYYRSAGMSIRDIAKKTGLKRSTIHDNTKGAESGPSSKPLGRPKILQPRLRKAIFRGFEHGNFLSPTAAVKYLANEHNTMATAQTIRNELRAMGMRAHKKPSKLLLSRAHRQQRLNWAKAMSKVEDGFWDSVIFTDESKFNLFAPDGYEHVWRLPGPPTLKHHVRSMVKHGGGYVMVWGAITRHGVGRLIFIEGTMDSKVFVDVLDRGFNGTLKMYDLAPESVYLQQDNDPKHTSKYTQEWISGQEIESIGWAACSPDMSIIEHVWRDVDVRLRARVIQPMNRQELMRALTEEWYSTPASYIKALYDSMPRRVEALLKAKGGFTKY